MKKKNKIKDEEIVKSISEKIDKVVLQELMRAEVTPLHINVALLCAVSKSLLSEAIAHKTAYGTDPENRIIKQIDILREQTLQDLKERLSHGEE